MFQSILGCRQAIINEFTNQMTKPGNEENLLDLADKNLKAYSSQQLSIDQEYWSAILYHTPMLEMFSSLSTHLESDLCPISFVPLAFATLYEFSKTTLIPAQAEVICRLLVLR